MPESLNVAVFFGGWSPEREVSILSAYEVGEILIGLGYSVSPVMIDTDGSWRYANDLLDLCYHKQPELTRTLPTVALMKRGAKSFLVPISEDGRLSELIQIDLAIPVFHGVPGEDGSIQGVFETTQTPYLGSGVSASVCGLDKILQRMIFKNAGIPCLEYVVLTESEWHARPSTVHDRISGIGYPIIVKPARLGSSIGIEVIHERDQLSRSLSRAFIYDSQLLVEPFLEDMTEINCGVYHADGYECSECERPISTGKILSFQDKYIVSDKNKPSKGSAAPMGEGDTKRVFPADISESDRISIQRLTLEVAELLELRGFARVDFMIHNGTVLVNEVNTIPGSMALYLWDHGGSCRASVLEQAIRSSIGNSRQRSGPGPDLISRGD